MMRLPNPFRRRAAFTLLELLIAMAIFSVVLVAINGVFYGAMRLRNKTTHMIEEVLPLQQAAAIIKRDLQGIVAPGGVLGGPLQSGQSGRSVGGTTPQGATTIYTSTGSMNDASPFAEVQKVVYYLKNSDNQKASGKDLVRGVSRNLLATTQEQLVEQWLMGGVERLQLTYFDGTSWRDSWDSTTADLTTGQTNNLPRAIKVEIELAVEFGEPRSKAPVQLIVPIVVQARSNLTAQATGGRQ